MPAGLRTTGFVGVAVVAVALMAACRSPRSVELESSQWEDVPLPVNFEPHEPGQRSFRYRDAELEYGIFFYRGQAPVSSVAAFYERVMPSYGWDRRASPEGGDVASDAARLERRTQAWMRGEDRIDLAIEGSPRGPTELRVERKRLAPLRESTR